MSKENTQKTNELDLTSVDAENAEEETQFQEVVEVPWEEVEQVTTLKQAVGETEEYVSRFLLDLERRKSALLVRLGEMENALYQQAQALKQSKNLNPDWAFELKLP